MKTHVWDYDFGQSMRFATTTRTRRRKTVSQILRAAYRKHVRDAHTKKAIKHCLR